ncbi:MAG: CvpA family protein [Lachnospiraceae bacterium]|jgi:hypothetical protein|nr:CvpA family protein [Lachnospiraceae bacterium]
MKKSLKKLPLIILILLAACIYYYVTIPAFNIHATGTWMFLICGWAVIVLLFSWRKFRFTKGGKLEYEKEKGFTFTKLGFGILGLMVLVLLIGSLLSSPIVNARKYQQLLTVENREFTEDIKPVDYTQIPLLDKASAELLGNRKMGTMVEYVSQFEVSSIYSQINYQGKPVRVTPLVYASPIKWLTNQADGIPAYIMIDMTTQETECVKLAEPIRFSMSEYFGRNIYRHLRFNYPTYIFDQLSFEIDDEGTPYWICPVKQFNVGLFGGQTIGKVVLCNAITGATQSMDVDQVPEWVDRVYPADLLVELYDYHGILKNGFFNSILGQRGCLQTTDGFNYIAMDDDVWVYTGVTSVSGDESNVGFVLMNQRTMETRYYTCAGAEEYSAMSSAEGQVQNLGYSAAFPLLLNISGEPTYFLALKDGAGLVKKYAMVNIQRYQIVAIGDTAADCEKAYRALMAENKITQTDEEAVKDRTGTIRKITSGVIEGNTYYYLMLENSDDIFEISLADFVEIVRYEPGDRITMRCLEGTKTWEVLELK